MPAAASNLPAPQGLYDARHEHDACGVAFVATLTGQASHEIIDLALTALRNLEHRGASGSDPESGDGAGILVQVPDAFFRAVVDFVLPAPGEYAAGIAFLPASASADAMAAIETTISTIAADEGLHILGWRDVPVQQGLVGAAARAVQPLFRQLFVAATRAGVAGLWKGEDILYRIDRAYPYNITYLPR